MLFIVTYSFAQTGIGTSTPHASAKLEVNATDKGFLPPRVALTATNSASPITSPANGLMVFNTVTAGINPFQVVPGYYYWDGIGLKWVSLSTTVGNVQNQAIFRSTSNTTGGTVVSTWDSRFNNIAAGDLTITSNTSFALSNGVYKIQWGLPYQSSLTYNVVQLQENVSGTWGAWRGDANLAGLANGGGTDWGGTTFMTDYIDCSTATRMLRFYNPDSRTLYYGASFIITKLNPSVTTSTTADNLGNHTATKNVGLNENYISNDGDNEGIRIDNSGNVGIGNNAPTAKLDVTGTLEVSGKATLRDLVDIGTGIGDEGGEFQFAIPATNTTLQTRVKVDVWQNRLRFFEGSTNAKGVHIDLSKAPNNASGELIWKASGLVNRGVDVTLGNLKARIAATGNISLQISTVSGTYSVYGSSVYSQAGAIGTTIDGGSPRAISTTPVYLNSSYSFGTAGATDTWNIMDTSNSIAWRITMILGAGTNNNLITIERLF